MHDTSNPRNAANDRDEEEEHWMLLKKKKNLKRQTRCAGGTQTLC